MSETWQYGTVAEGDEGSFPWPPAEDDSPLAAFGETWRSATFDPAAFFRRVPRDGGTGAAVVYYLVIVVLVAGASLVWNSLSLVTGGQLDELGLGTGAALSPLVTFLLTPGILLALLFVGAAITHMILSLFDGASNGFGTTIRVFAYAYSPGIFGVVPFIGGLIGSVWMVVLLVVGLKEAHETDGWKTAVAVLLPFALLLGLLVLSFLMMIAAGAAIMGAGT
ncbi:MAG: YIP1 family protein [Gemmatimonadota bacterium]